MDDLYFCRNCGEIQGYQKEGICEYCSSNVLEKIPTQQTVKLKKRRDR